MDTSVFKKSPRRQLDEWDVEWDRMGHTELELRKEIAELRARIVGYVNEIDDLQMELRAANADLLSAQDENKRLHAKLKARLDG